MKTKITLLILMVISITFLLYRESDFNNAKFSEMDNGLVISEVIPYNTSLITDGFGNYFDIIEIYNGSDYDINLKNYGLTNDPEVTHKWNFPNIEITSGEYLLVFAGGKESEEFSEISDLIYCDFKLDKDGGKVLLSNYKGKVSSAVAYEAVKPNMSYGTSDTGYDYYLKGSPSLLNEGIIIKDMNIFMKNTIIKPSHNGGIYNEPLNVSFPDYKDYVIKYTLDSSDPTYQSKEYTEPIYIDYTKDLPSKVSNIPTSYYPIGYVEDEFINMGLVLKAQYFDGEVPIGEMFVGSYFVWEEGADRYSFDIVSLTSESSNLYSADDGISMVGDKYFAVVPEWPDGATAANYNQRGKEWERPANIEFYDSDGNQTLNQAIGIRIAGGWTRAYNKKSFKLYARDEYGEDTLDINLFDGLVNDKGEEIDSFKKIVLRNGGNDFERSIFRDLVSDQLVSGLLDFQAYKPVILFVDGEYYGIFNVRENMDENFVASHFDIDSDDVNIIEYSSEGISYYAGDDSEPNRFNKFMDFVDKNDLTLDENYNYVKSMIDIDDFIDYYLLQIYIYNQDWPHNNTRIWRYSGPVEDGGKDGLYRYLLYDTDFSFGIYQGATANQFDSFDSLENNTNDSSPNPTWATLLYQKLIDNEDFREIFLTKLFDNLNSRYSISSVNEVIDNFEDIYYKEIDENIHRWQLPVYNDVEQWSTETVYVLRDFVELRGEYLLKYANSHYNLNQSIELNINSFDGGRLNINDYYTLEASEAEQTLNYFSAYSTKFQAINDNGYIFDHWIITDENNIDSSKSIILGDINSETIEIKTEKSLLITPIFILEK